MGVERSNGLSSGPLEARPRYKAQMIFCADLGATKAWLGLVQQSTGRPLDVLHARRYVAADWPQPLAMLEDFLNRWATQAGVPGQVDAAALGVAGPVVQDPQCGASVQMTNLGWRLEAAAISRLLGGAPVQLVNDFHAAACGLDAVAPDRLLSLQAGTPDPRAPQLVLGAGSGLGVALRVWGGQGYQVVPGEGGHYGFAPSNPRLDRVLAFLRAERPRVVVEHVVSGPGLANLYRFVAWEAGAGPPPAGLTGEEVFRRLTQAADPLAAEAFDLFLAAYGSVAGDYALAGLARGGVYLAGGIAAKCAGLMADGRFLHAFRDKGPYSGLMQSVPVTLVQDEQLGLLGAAMVAFSA